MNDASPAAAYPAPSAELLDRFAAIVGGRYALRDPDATAPYLVEQRGLYTGKAAMVLRPGSVEEVSQILRLANETRTAIVPQGGNTGLVGGQIPYEAGNEIVLSLGRLNRIRNVDADGNTLTAEAGCVLADIQAAAGTAGRLFPLSLGAEGSCQIGGNLSTNAGGIAVLAYGNARELTLGLEVVLADGRVWEGLRALRKDNTGYDLKDLFIGAEGTLGVITAAVLKLFPLPRFRETAIAGIASPQAAVDLFHHMQGAFGNGLTSFELLPRIGIEFTVRHGQGVRDPLDKAYPWYALMEVSSGEDEGVARAKLEGALAQALEKGTALDAVIAASGAQAAELWRIREILPEAQGPEGGSIKHDVSVPVSAVPAFMAEAERLVASMIPGARPVPFGHLGDGNIHYNISQPVGGDTAAFLARWEAVNEAVHAVVARLNGSISAEHGIGRLKRRILPQVKSPVELDLMRQIKRMLDPNGILNPGKIL